MACRIYELRAKPIFDWNTAERTSIKILKNEASVKIPHASRPIKPEFRNCDILVRIQILGSVPLTNGSGYGCGSIPKSSVTFREQKNQFFDVLITEI